MRPSIRRAPPLNPSGAGSDEDARIIELNPWWVRDDWSVADPHLRRLHSQPITLPARLVDSFDIATPGVHTIRGPRQVGKSTDLKLLAQRALMQGYQPRQIVYLALDLLGDQPIAALAHQIDRAKALAAAEGRCLLLLDEVTTVANWQTAVKELWDRGVIDGDVVVCTGSSAIDLARGTSERLPGRRAAGRDHLVLPQSFDVFAGALIPGLPPSPALSLSGLFTSDGQDALRQVQLYGPQLERALDRYARFGGLPAAVVEASVGAEGPSEEVQRVLWDSLRREISRKGASEPAGRALLERVMRSLGSKTNWSHMAQEMAVPLGRRGTGRTDHKTLRDYIEFLAGGYFLLIVYFWKRDADSSSVSKDKKVYFGDPLLHQITREFHSPGLPFNAPALVENLVALALYRRYEPAARQIEGFLDPGDLHVWETSKRREVDFVCGPRTAIDAAEVKYQSRIDRRELSGLKRAFPSRPVVMVTKNELELTQDHALIPSHLLLWALG